MSRTKGDCNGKHGASCLQGLAGGYRQRGQHPRSTTSSSRMLQNLSHSTEPSAPTVSWGTTSWRSFPRTTLREKLDTWYAQHASLKLQTFYPSASDAMERLSAGGRKKQRKTRALPLECLKGKDTKAEMAKMLMTKTSRRRLTDWSESQRKIPKRLRMTTLTWPTPNQVMRTPDLKKNVGVMYLIRKLYSATTPKSNKRKRMRRLPKNKTRMKNAGKRGCSYLCGQRESSKLQLFSASTLPRTRTPSTARLVQWIAWFWATSRIDIGYIIFGLQWHQLSSIMTTWRGSGLSLNSTDTFHTWATLQRASWKNQQKNNWSLHSMQMPRAESLADVNWKLIWREWTEFECSAKLWSTWFRSASPLNSSSPRLQTIRTRTKNGS